MDIFKLTNLFAKLAAYDRAKDLESLIRAECVLPSNWLTKSDLRNAVERVSNLKPVSDNDRLIDLGYKFCKKLITLVDQLKEHADEELSVIKSDVFKLAELLNINIAKSEDNSISQFPHVSAFLNFVKPSKRVETSSQKERMVISRIIGICEKLMSKFDELEKLSGKIPVKFVKEDVASPKYEKPIPGQILRTQEKMQEFLILHGDELNIPNEEVLRKALSDCDQDTLVLFRTVYNSFKRGNETPANLHVLKEVLGAEFKYQQEKLRVGREIALGIRKHELDRLLNRK